MVALVFGIIFIVISVIIICVRTFSTQKRMDKLLGSERKKIGETLDTYRQTKSDLGEMGKEGVVSEQMTVMGSPKCEDPLTSPLGQKPCIYYEMSVTSKTVERESYTDSNGNRQTRTVTRETTLENNKNSTRFTLDDGTGSLLVDPHDGTFEGLITTVDRSEAMLNGSGDAVSFGGFRMSLGGRTRPESLHYVEKIIGLDRPLTVVGTLCDKMGDMLIENCGKSKVLVSTQSYDDMILGTKSSLKTQLIATIACGGIGIILTVVGLIIR